MNNYQPFFIPSPGSASMVPLGSAPMVLLSRAEPPITPLNLEHEFDSDTLQEQPSVGRYPPSPSSIPLVQ